MQQDYNVPGMLSKLPQRGLRSDLRDKLRGILKNLGF